ncbi:MULTISPECIES: helix-turn-helix domain-containing protein [Bacillaceae]|uniref:Transcriptional regulator n=1 Tax=Domibacillus aminovorans TaxID=29332 RepID=A0A177KPC8_9BACI|nr:MULTISPECIES: helix-turn-helix domain-containing protein [Bacillaceae]OAH54745.1 transcriptional regulator [Domibacillus aminovorans]
MKHSKMKLILHPVRMKIIQSLVNGRKLTVQQLTERIKDVPQATLYRHMNTLLEAEFIEVVQENQIRGTVEKVFALKEQKPEAQEEFLNWSKEEHIELFFAFTTQLLGLYENYLNKGDVDLVKDGVGYRVANLHVTDEEYVELVQKIGALIQEASLNEPSSERKVKNLATIIIPE